MPTRILSSIAILLPLLLACQTERKNDDGADAAPPLAQTTDKVADEAVAPSSGGKPSAPITIRYRVLGTAIVGQPVPVELTITSSVTDRPIAVSYHINDSNSMVFPESQARRVNVRIGDDGDRAARQVTVVPQREGRLYLNVLAEIDTEAGPMIKSMAVPISVGRGLEKPAANGELKQGADGETVMSMPAEEKPR